MEDSLLSCFLCKHRFKNDVCERKTINGKRMDAFAEYCGFNGKGKNMKRISSRDRPANRHYPAWCPLYQDSSSCFVCGKVMYADEGTTCNTHSLSDYARDLLTPILLSDVYNPLDALFADFVID